MERFVTTTNPNPRGIFTSELWLTLAGPVGAALLSNFASLDIGVQKTLIICATIGAVAYTWLRSAIKRSVVEEMGMLGQLTANRLTPPAPVAPGAEAKGFIMRKLVYLIVALAIFAGSALAVMGAGGCVSKPGSEAIQPEGLQYRDPSLTHSTAQLGLDGPTQIGGPLNQETSQLDAERMQETSGGGAAKQRAAVSMGLLRAMLSASSDFETSDIRVAFDTEGRVTSASIGKLSTNNTAVQRAVNDGVTALVAQWSKATEAERAVLEAQLKTQAAMGEAAAQTALSIITAIK
jgi:hypothetical protein